ncbi:MAG: YoaK family protein [Gemmatimonadaceae bacterium]|nr:YoaK family protein [Gemmatimonadaceae bacterium]
MPGELLRRRRGLRSAYAQPLLLEALLLLIFGILGVQLAHLHAAFVPITVALLCFTMGVQNAVITKISGAEVRTTHVTGIVTDIGIELGLLLYINRRESAPYPRVKANRARLRTLLILLVAFFVGGVLGALGFQRVGYAATVPLAAVLLLLTLVPVVDDLRARVTEPTDVGGSA